MVGSGRPRYRSFLKAAFLTAGASLLVFGLSHAAFITWAVPPKPDPADEPALLLRLAVMFAAPIAFGVPWATLGALLGAAAWRAAWGTPLATWRYGVVLASALLPPFALSIAHGPFGEEVPGGPVIPLLFASIVLLPTILAMKLGGIRGGALVGVSVAPYAFLWTMFLLGSGLAGWVAPFAVSLVAILVASGWLMARLTARLLPEPFSGGGLSAAP